MRVLVLGHNGMLGHMVFKYLSQQGATVFEMPARWPNDDFKSAIQNNLGNIEYIVNCIGAIPQHKKYQFEDFVNINVALPVWLARNTNCKIIHPTTDCEFSGGIPEYMFYYKNDPKDARDNYGLSKAMASEILEWFPNVKQIRTSIFGPELKTKVSIFEWFMSQTGDVKGYSNHFWNGISTLEWSKLALNIMEKWDLYDSVIQVGTSPIAKSKLLELINESFKVNKTIIPIEHIYCNKCLHSDLDIKTIEEQLTDLKKFYANDGSTS